MFKLQSENLKAYKIGVVADVLKAQHRLTRSFAARALAVRKVTTNKGEEELYLFQIPYVSIKRHLLCKDLNAYDPEAIEYFF